MMKFFHIIFCLCLGLSGVSHAQNPLADLPIKVGGYIHDESGRPIKNASVTFIDQVHQIEFTGSTNSAGWYGNLGDPGLRKTPVKHMGGTSDPTPCSAPMLITLPSEYMKDVSADILTFAGKPFIEILKNGNLIGYLPASTGTHGVLSHISTEIPFGLYEYKIGKLQGEFCGKPRDIPVVIYHGSAGQKYFVEYLAQVTWGGKAVRDSLVSLDIHEVNHVNFR